MKQNIEQIQNDPEKCIEIDRTDRYKAWVRYRDGEFEVYSQTKGFLQDRMFTTPESKVLSKMEKHDYRIVPESKALFEL